jgi:shikimate dehydrogenase
MTGRAFVVGWPARHSRSPLIHRYWLALHGIDGDYRAEEVPAADLGAFLAGMESAFYVGGNVTVPHKEQAFALAARRTPVAERLGAANTLWLEDHVLCADNTDVHGFAANLDERLPGWREIDTALVLGAGGAARAVVFALVEAGIGEIMVLNRTAARADVLAEMFGGSVVGHGLDALPALLGEAGLIVNTTSVGMSGKGALKIDWTRASRGAVATDLVYVPLQTEFLRSAAAAGLRTVDGLGMLLHQAAPGFERWFGVRPTVDAELRRLVVADLGR